MWFGALNTVAVCVFVCESILKLVAVGCHEFWRGEDCVWILRLDFHDQFASAGVASVLKALIGQQGTKATPEAHRLSGPFMF